MESNQEGLLNHCRALEQLRNYLSTYIGTAGVASTEQITDIFLSTKILTHAHVASTQARLGL